MALAGNKLAAQRANHPAALADADSDDALVHHHSNPFLEPPVHGASITSNVESITSHVNNNTSPQASASPGNSAHFNPFEDSHPSLNEQHRQHATSADADQRHQHLSGAESELPPFTLADLRATMSDLPHDDQPATADLHTADLDRDKVQTAGFNPFLDGATDHISPNAAVSLDDASVNHQHGSEQPHASPSGDESHPDADVNPFLQRHVDHSQSASAVQATAADRQTHGEAAGNQQPAPFADFANAGFSNRAADSVQAPQNDAHSMQSQTQDSHTDITPEAPRIAQSAALSPDHALADESISDVLSQHDFMGSADFHSVTAGDEDQSSPTQDSAQQHRQSQLAEEQHPEPPSLSAASDLQLASTLGHTQPVNDHDGTPSAVTSVQAQQHARQSDLAAPLGTLHTSGSNGVELEHDFAQFDGGSEPAQSTASPEPVLVLEQVSSQGMLRADKTETDDFADLGSAPALRTDSPQPEHVLNSAVQATHDSEQPSKSESAVEPSHQETAAAQQQGLPDNDLHQPSDVITAEAADEPQPAPASTSELAAALPTQASLDQELADDDLAEAADASGLANTGTEAVADALPSQASLDHQLATDAEDLGAATNDSSSVSAPAAADALPSQASMQPSMQQKLADDGFADFADGFPHNAVSPSALPSQAAVDHTLTEAPVQKAEALDSGETAAQADSTGEFASMP